MRIAIFSDNFYPELSGVSDSIIASAGGLGKLGHHIVIFAPRYSERDFKTSNLPFREPDLGKNVAIRRFCSIPFKGAGSTGQSRIVIPTGLRWLFIRKFKPDVLHTQFMYGVGLEGLIAAKILRRPLVGTNHTALGEFLRFSPIRKERFKKSILRYQAWYYNSCDFVTSPSEVAFKEMIQNGFSRPHRTLSNPLDLSVFKPVSGDRKKELKKKFGFSESTVCCAGRLGPEKNVDVVIRALALVKERMPSVNLAVAGHGSEAESLRKLAVQLGLEENVKFLGTLPHRALAEVYEACDVFAIASTSETQGMTMMQGFACGLPAVGVRALALSEYINERNGFLVEAGDYRAFAEKLKVILADNDLREKLSAGGVKSVQKLSVENIAKEWERIYLKAIENYENKLRHTGS